MTSNTRSSTNKQIIDMIMEKRAAGINIKGAVGGLASKAKKVLKPKAVGSGISKEVADARVAADFDKRLVAAQKAKAVRDLKANKGLGGGGVSIPKTNTATRPDFGDGFGKKRRSVIGQKPKPEAGPQIAGVDRTKTRLRNTPPNTPTQTPVPQQQPPANPQAPVDKTPPGAVTTPQKPGMSLTNKLLIGGGLVAAGATGAGAVASAKQRAGQQQAPPTQYPPGY